MPFVAFDYLFKFTKILNNFICETARYDWRKKNPRPLWAHPWNYQESFIIVFLLLLVSLFLGAITRGWEITPISIPFNIYIASAFVFLLVFISIFYRNKPIVQWLSSVPAALTAISFFALTVMVMGLLPQDVPYSHAIIRLSGLSHIKTSWLLLFAQLFFLTTLGLVTIRRCFPFTGRNIGFFLNHFGLFLVLLTATLGYGDIQRLNMNLLRGGRESNIGVSGQGDMFKLPFTLRLLNFTIEEYNPRLALLDSHTGGYKPTENMVFPMIEKGMKTKIGNWNIEISDYFPQAIFRDSFFVKCNETGSYPVANLRAINAVTKDTAKGWASSGSYLQSPVYLPIDSGTMLALTVPEPKEYSSLVEVITDSLNIDTVTIEVNKPHTVKGWKIYQVSYDQNKGKWSTLSVLEAVNDPWLPVVYTGFFLIMAGSVFLFWTGRIKN